MKSLVFALALWAGGVSAQQWPSKPLRYIVPFPPGAFNDTLARTLSAELPKALGQPVVVENRPGGNTIIGTEAAAKSPPDGYTLFGAALPFSVVQSLYRTSFDVTKDFAPITLAGMTPNLLVANPAVPFNDVKGLIAYAKANPGKLNYASTGNGTSNHLSFELFKTMTATQVTHVAYKGSAPAVTDLIAGQVQVMFDNTPNVLPHVKAGKLKALGVSSKSRTPFASEIPTVDEAGVPGYDVGVWFGVLTVAGTPRDVVQRLNTEMVKILASADVRERFGKMGVDVVAGTPDQFSQFLKSEVVRWAKVIQDAGIKAD
ncbi:MAG TPA: tripartite tricarboxylate transporter substrate binding protein [Burkholderiales bacterium]|nr:tripartite tricarboxylate transporter substrate binding protein [Burkholderiales bacterium]